jgi:hypothetical protein
MEKAAEYHRKAAENYLRAQENTENPEVSFSGRGNIDFRLCKLYHYYMLNSSLNINATHPFPSPLARDRLRPHNVSHPVQNNHPVRDPFPKLSIA